jgi:hypothetical protein
VKGIAGGNVFTRIKMKPALSAFTFEAGVPGIGQHLQPTVWKFDEILLEGIDPESVLDLELLLAAVLALGFDEETAILSEETRLGAEMLDLRAVELRHDPALGLLSGKLEARRSDCAVLAGKSTLNRLEHAPKTNDDRYRKLAVDEDAMKKLFVGVFLKRHATPPKRIILDLDATDDPIHGDQEGRFFHGYYTAAPKDRLLLPCCATGGSPNHDSLAA